MARASFAAPLRASGRGGGHLVEVPTEVIEALGGRGRIRVRATFNGVPYRGSIVRMGGAMVLGVTKAIAGAAGAAVGDDLAVTVENDEEPRVVEIPDELARALRANRTASEYFDSLSYSHRREYVGYVTEAKRPQTRTRRVERTIERLVEAAEAKRPR